MSLRLIHKYGVPIQKLVFAWTRLTGPIDIHKVGRVSMDCCRLRADVHVCFMVIKLFMLIYPSCVFLLIIHDFLWCHMSSMCLINFIWFYMNLDVWFCPRGAPPPLGKPRRILRILGIICRIRKRSFLAWIIPSTVCTKVYTILYTVLYYAIYLPADYTMYTTTVLLLYALYYTILYYTILYTK